MGKERYIPASIARGIAAAAIGTSIFVTPAYGESFHVPQRDQYYKPFEQTFLQAPQQEMGKYLVDPEGNIKTRALVAEKLDDIVPLFKSDEFHNLTRAEVEEDLNMYFDMYWAGWEKYQVPWYMLWVMHIQESTVSRDKKAENDGALQVYRGNLNSMPGLLNADDGYERLRDLPQRFSTRGGARTTDSQEILRGASYIRLFANERITRNPKTYADNDEKAVLDVVNKDYSAEIYGDQRVKKYKEIKKILEPSG